MNDNDLVKNIESSYPLEGSLGNERLVYDNSGYHLECNYVKAFFQGKKWNEITCTALFLDYEYDSTACFNFLTNEAFCYYLPAFMNLVIDCYDDADLFVDNLIDKLIDLDDEDFKSWSMLLDRNQRKSVCLFLEYIINTYSDDFSGEISGIKRANIVYCN